MKCWLLSIALLMVGCVTQTQVTQFEEFIPQSKTFVLLSPKHELDNELRKELSKRGFKIKKFASTVTRIDSNKIGTRSEIYKPAEARYGLYFSTNIVTECAWGGWLIDGAEIEITDLETNEVLLVLENRGMKEHQCVGYAYDQIFTIFGDALSEAWGS